LQNSDTAIEKLFIQSEIERVIKGYANLKNESVEEWKNKINKSNYENYDKELTEEFEKKNQNYNSKC